MLAMSNTECRCLDDIDDILIVKKIQEQDATSLKSNIDLSESRECLCSVNGFDCEQNIFVEEQEAIIKKQLQLLQADERGKQALNCEIAALKQKQEHRAQLIRNRQRALDIEKERARKIASLPPPLPKSVKLLLKKSDNESKTNEPDVKMPDELTAFTINPVEQSYENKENIIDPKELEAKQKMQKDWEMKAKKRFNEALKKNRQQEEYSNIMKQIQNAELLNRREMAKNISSHKKGLPCPLSDKFQTAKNQADMEEATEKLFKETGTKEHVIEDIEGYEDHYEEKYKKIDSNYEAKMIDCVPSFVKENYEYLLEDDSKFLGGKNFSRLDDSSSDIFNQAYIETPPGVDEDGKKKIDSTIRQLDKLRSNIQAEYEETLKPLLLATTEVPKKELSDKAVETESVKIAVVDKAVETDEQFKAEITSPSTPPTLNYTSAGVMAYKRRRRQYGPILSNYHQMNLPDMHQRDVCYAVPSVPQSEDLAAGSWSPSSYCSLPSKHGVPTFSSGSGSMRCDICVAELEKNSIKDHFLPENFRDSGLLAKEKSDKSTISNDRAPLSEYVKQLAKKYLGAKSALGDSPKKDAVKAFNDSNLPLYSNTSVNPAFEKEIIGKSKTGLFVENQKSEQFVLVPGKSVASQKETFQASSPVVEKPVLVTKTDRKIIPDSHRTSIKTSEILEESDKKEYLQDDFYNNINFLSPKSPVEYSDYDFEAKRVQAIHQVLARRIPRFTIGPSTKPEENNNAKESENSVQNMQTAKDHVYHELSTIQELDSALTAGSLQLSQSKLSDTSMAKVEKVVHPEEKSKEVLVQSTERLKMVSLLDSLDSPTCELAKNIHFVPETEEKSHPLKANTPVSSEHLNAMSSNEDVPVSSQMSSSDSNSVSSFSSGAKVFSSTFTGSQVKHLKDVGSLPQHFKDLSDIQKKVSGSNSYSSIPTPEFSSGTPVSSSSQSIPSVSDIRSKEKKDIEHSISSGTECLCNTYGSISIANMEVPKNIKSDTCKSVQENMPSIISGYISDLEVPQMSKSDSTHLNQEKNNVHSIMSGYISDLEVPEITKTDVLSPSQEQSANMHSIISGYISDIEVPSVSDSAVFYLMTPHSDISSPGIPSNVAKPALKHEGEKKNVVSQNLFLKQDHVLLQSSSDRSFKPMTPQSNISSPSELASLASVYKHHGLTRSTGSFKALTPQYDISSPGELASLASVYKHHGLTRSTGSFKALTPQYDISSPGELATSKSPEYEHQSFRSVESFKALTPLCNTSSRGSTCFSSKREHQSYGDSSGSFKALSPKSMISSPSFSSGEVELRRDIPSESLEFQPLILRLNISTSSLSSDSTSSKSQEREKNVKFRCNFALPKPANYMLPCEAEGQGIITEATDGKSYVGSSKNEVKMKKKLNVYPCSSDFFVPSITGPLTSSEEKINQHDLVKNALTSENVEDNNKPKLTSDSPVTTPRCDKENQKKSLQQKQSVQVNFPESDTECTSSDNFFLTKGIKDTPLVQKSKESNKKQNLRHFETARSFCKQFISLQAMSSTSSSTENLSEISSSKVVYQSTPIKSLSEIMQEPGIMEEPDLTLITTQLSCKVDQAEIPKDPSTSTSLECSASEKKDCTITPTQNECKTPSFQSPQFIASEDTPSLLSFLRHEESCMQAENYEVNSPAEGMNVSPSTTENKTPKQREVKRSLFQRVDYKQRTKRLWNNLEEVKKKNSVEERRRLMEINRKKAKEYAQKLTPKQKRK